MCRTWPKRKNLKQNEPQQTAVDDGPKYKRKTQKNKTKYIVVMCERVVEA